MKTKSVKSIEATERNSAWAKLTPAQQLDYLDKSGLVATKQRAKIAKRMTEK